MLAFCASIGLLTLVCLGIWFILITVHFISDVVESIQETKRLRIEVANYTCRTVRLETDLFNLLNPSEYPTNKKARK